MFVRIEAHSTACKNRNKYYVCKKRRKYYCCKNRSKYYCL